MSRDLDFDLLCAPDVPVSAEDTVESARKKAHQFATKHHGWLHKIGEDEKRWCGHLRDVNFDVHSPGCNALGVVYEAHRKALTAREKREWNEDELPTAIQKGSREGMYGCRRASTRDVLLMLQRSQPTVRDVMKEARRIHEEEIFDHLDNTKR